MKRCLYMAKHGAGNVAPNPMVGAVLVYEGRIIGEGYHQQYGHPHAEVNCLNSVASQDQQFIPLSTLYVTLEPCAHYGKTPPCADLIINRGIRKVVVGTRDPFDAVNGKGIEKLLAAGIEVVEKVLGKECRELNKRFFTFHELKRPYIILKWAQTADAMIGSGTGERLMISNNFSSRLVHKWRSEEAAILVGTNTALMDDPSLDVRYWSGKSPIRLVLDLDLKLSPGLKIFNGKQKTILFNTLRQEEKGNVLYCQLGKNTNIISHVLDTCYRMNIQSVLVEGGAKLLSSFIDDARWDEARIITSLNIYAGKGLPAPLLINARETGKENILSDTITYFANNVNRA